ncbi:MAG: hypothetical protein WAK11_01480 [Candidatus Cybelea sp.]
MKSSGLGSRGLPLAVGGGLAGCGLRCAFFLTVATALAAFGAQPPLGGAGAIAQSHSFSVHSDQRRSWMAPGAAKDDLLYITNQDTVTVYSYPDGT